MNFVKQKTTYFVTEQFREFCVCYETPGISILTKNYKLRFDVLLCLREHRNHLNSNISHHPSTFDIVFTLVKF